VAAKLCLFLLILHHQLCYVSDPEYFHFSVGIGLYTHTHTHTHTEIVSLSCVCMWVPIAVLFGAL